MTEKVYKKVILSLVDGNLKKGFKIQVLISTDGENSKIIDNFSASVPACPDLYEIYTHWQTSYRKVITGRRFSRMPMQAITPEEETVKQQEFLEACKANYVKLSDAINSWLSLEKRSISKLDRKINRKLREDDYIRLIIQTEDSLLQKIPIFLWKDFFSYFRRAEVVFALQAQSHEAIKANFKVKVLVVFGEQELVGADTLTRIDSDWKIIQDVLSEKSNAELICLQQPTSIEMWDKIREISPQILYFAGHSFTSKDLNEGRFLLNKDECLTIQDFSSALRVAAKKGLKLAIFNSCDGIGIARQLEAMGISNVIVMQEPIPDEVAQRFLKLFLQAFTAGKPLHIAVRRAKEYLEPLENKFCPGASILPMIWQDYSESSLTWKQLGGITTDKYFQNSEFLSKPSRNSSKADNQQHEVVNNLDFSLAPETTTAQANNEIYEEKKKISFHGYYWQAGHKFNNRPYEILNILGEGGFGITFQARNLSLDIPLVIKTPNIRLQRDKNYCKYIDNFKREAQQLAKLGMNPHPHIVRVFDFFEEDNLPCIVMEYVPGESLYDLLQVNGTLSEKKALEYIRQIASALVVCHQQGIIHRDPHLNNILIHEVNGKAILIDFGISGTTQSSRDTRSGNQSFAPWEQLINLGDQSSKTPQVDIYILASSFYYLLTGDIPTPSLVRKLKADKLKEPKQINPQISDSINKAILKGMAVEPEDRPKSVSEWLNLLDSIDTTLRQ